jgi:hypothetical protein
VQKVLAESFPSSVDQGVVPFIALEMKTSSFGQHRALLQIKVRVSWKRSDFSSLSVTVARTFTFASTKSSGLILTV